MTDNTELEQRRTRAANETLVIAPTEGGFRVYNPANITHLFMVSGIPDSPICNCPEFDSHKSDPGWRCRHVLAVLHQNEKAPVTKPNSSAQEQTGITVSEEKRTNTAEKKKSKTARIVQHPQMEIK